MERYIDPSVLENGKVLLSLKQDFINERTRPNVIALLGCLRDSCVWVPVSMALSGRDQEALMGVKAGDTWENQDQIRLRPDILETPDQKRWFPIFTQREQIPEEYARNFSIARISALRCLELANSMEGIEGFLLDAFTAPLALPFAIVNIMTELESRLAPKPSAEKG